MRTRQLNTILALAAVCIGAVASVHAGTLDTVRARGVLQCGVSTGLAGFAAPDDKGEWRGIDSDFCRAVAAAIFHDARKVKFVPLNAKERFTALQSGEVDLLSRNTSWTMSRDTSLGLTFTGVMYYDGQGFMVPKKLGVKSAKELNGATVCVQPGTTTELNLADYFRANKMTFKPVVIEKVEEIRAAFYAGRCDVYTTDASGLYSTRAANTPAPAKPDDFIILPEIISKEPLGPVVRHGDNQFADIVRWSLFAMIEAEEYGISSKNVDQVAAMAGVRPLGFTPYRRSMARIPAPGGQDVGRWPMMFGPGEDWYAKPDAGALIVSPAEEDLMEPHDAWADDMVLAEGLARYEEMVTEPVTRLLASWAGLRTFAPDRVLVIGPDVGEPSFFWLAGQGGYGFQTCPAASRLAADLIAGRMPELDAGLVAQLDPARFGRS